MIHLLNGNTAERSRSSDGCTVYPCGCAHTDTHWLQLCDAHYGPTLALHQQARQDHAARDLI